MPFRPLSTVWQYLLFVGSAGINMFTGCGRPGQSALIVINVNTPAGYQLLLSTNQDKKNIFVKIKTGYNL